MDRYRSEAQSAENTSGQGGSSAVPDEIRGWNWGACTLTWIWAVGNHVWIGLLGIVPYVDLVMAIVLGARGNVWAWQSKRWDSVEHFKRSQRKWTVWGLGLGFIGLIVSLLLLYYELKPYLALN